MSIEYFADVQLTDQELAELVAELPNDEFVALPDAKDGRFLFRVATNAVRERWPEDIELRASPKLYVAVHSARGDQRERFVRRVEKLLGELGHSCTLEED